MANHNAAPEPEQVDKELRVIELRRSGLTWQRIADEMGYADHSGAYGAYKRAVKRTLQQPTKEVREMEVDRLDRMQLALWARVLKGDDKAINTSLRIMERRARLLGLDAPTKIQAEVVNYDGHGLDAEVERIVRSIASIRIDGVDEGGEITLEDGASQAGTVTA